MWLIWDLFWGSDSLQLLDVRLGMLRFVSDLFVVMIGLGTSLFVCNVIPAGIPGMV